MQEHFRRDMGRLEDNHWWYRARRRILEHAVSSFVAHNPRALTVGVGARREAEMLSQYSRLVAIDRAPINPECREFSLAARADALALPFADGSFDAVFIFDVLEHLDDEKALAELRRVMTKDARLLVTVPAFMFLFGRQDVVSEHKRRYRLGPLARLLEGSGFRVDYATYFNTLLFPPIALIRVLRRIFPEPASTEASGSDFELRLPSFAEGILEKMFALERHAVGRWRLPIGISILCSARRA